MTLIDNYTHIHVVINRELPEEAYRRLMELDLSTMDGESGQLYYDSETDEWTMPF